MLFHHLNAVVWCYGPFVFFVMEHVLLLSSVFRHRVRECVRAKDNNHI